MIGGSPIGGENVGSFSIDNFVFGATGGGIGLSGSQGSFLSVSEVDSPSLGVSGSVVKYAVAPSVQGASIALSGGSGDPLYSFEITSSGFGLGSDQVSTSIVLGSDVAGLGVSGSAIAWRVVQFTLPAGIGVSGSEVQREVQGTLSVDIGASGLGLGLPAIDSDVILRGVPDFFVTRSGASATVTVRNRQGREVRLFRADDYNLTFTEITTFSNDTFTDTGLDPEKNYKYKLAFTVSITPPLNGQRSISKFTIV